MMSPGVHRLVRTFALGLLGGALFALAPHRASAQVKTTGGGKTDGGYGYEFTDDELQVGGFGLNDAAIRVRPGAPRSLLIKPRGTFVPEMLKSVENL